MTRINNPMEIYKLLNGSNCRDCGEKTCMAFAVAVFKNRKPLERCPHLSAEVLEQYGGQTEKPNTIDEDMIAAVESLKKKIPDIDLQETAERIGARYDGKKITVKVLGKDFSIYSDGTLSSDIHVNPWVAVPVLNYIIHGAGKPISGDWISFRELREGMERYSLFRQRCERPLKQIADTYTDLFRDMLDIFSARETEEFDSDVAVILYPLPLIPILVCYWEPEDGIESSLHIYFDKNVEANLDIDSIYTLTAGMVIMLTKLSQRHGF